MRALSRSILSSSGAAAGEGGNRGAGKVEVGDWGAKIGGEEFNPDVFWAGGGRVEVSACEMVGERRVNGVERGEKMRVGER